MDDAEQLVEQLARHARLFDERGWVMAGSGNFSVRLPSGDVLVTATGRHKGELTADDFVRLGGDGGSRPSSDTVVHRTIYEHCSDAGAIYHVHEPHAVAATARFPEVDAFDFAGYTILKAFGIQEVGEPAEVPVLVGGGRAEQLADRLERHLDERSESALPAVVADRHGLYAWGGSPARARWHIEALAHLFECKMIEESTR